MIELNQKEIEAVSGGTFGLIGSIVAFKVNIVKSVFGCFTAPKPPAPPVCKPPVVDPCKPSCPKPPKPCGDNGPDQGDL